MLDLFIDDMMGLKETVKHCDDSKEQFLTSFKSDCELMSYRFDLISHDELKQSVVNIFLTLRRNGFKLSNSVRLISLKRTIGDLELSFEVNDESYLTVSIGSEVILYYYLDLSTRDISKLLPR